MDELAGYAEKVVGGEVARGDWILVGSEVLK